MKESMMSEPRQFDGVICFGGGDWWYHNRGHYDMQMMRALSRHIPVLYVNSIGIRVPSVREGSMFVRRVTRKLRSFYRGFQRIDDRWGVCSPLAIPGKRGKAITRALLPGQVRLAARRMNIHRPLVWVTCPPAADFVDSLHPVASVYQRTDRWEEFPQANPAEIQRCDQMMKRKADATLFCADLLFKEEKANCLNPVYIDHGVDFKRFANAGQRIDVEGDNGAPSDVCGLPRPRVGFIGGIDSHTFDAALFVEVVARLPDHHFFLVGACSLPDNWCPHDNVSLLGQRPYEAVPAYMAAADVLIMPWNQNEWIRACNPVKLKEYLATGRPIVSCDFYELHKYEGLVRVANSPVEFAKAIRAATTGPCDSTPLRTRVEHETWTAKAEALLATLASRGVFPVMTQ
jgi:glycosyltransferase involved in cell wall biosynthesis